MILTLARIDKRESNRQAFDDNRFIVNRTIATYIGEDGYEYGKAFESHDEPVVPKSGTHKELNGMKVQYK
jgi:hypothetical protein